MIADLPPLFDKPTMQCIRYAAREYNLPQLAYMSILKVEGGRKGLKKQNYGVKDAYKYDYGQSQYNSSNIYLLEKYGIKNVEFYLQYDHCFNIRAGAWLLKREINDCGGLWCGVGNYHTGSNIKTIAQKKRHIKYRNEVYKASLLISSKYNWK